VWTRGRGWFRRGLLAETREDIVECGTRSRQRGSLVDGDEALVGLVEAFAVHLGRKAVGHTAVGTAPAVTIHLVADAHDHWFACAVVRELGEARLVVFVLWAEVIGEDFLAWKTPRGVWGEVRGVPGRGRIFLHGQVPGLTRGRVEGLSRRWSVIGDLYQAGGGGLMQDSRKRKAWDGANVDERGHLGLDAIALEEIQFGSISGSDRVRSTCML